MADDTYQHEQVTGDCRDGGERLIARWDLDKTYLRTEFDTFSDLVRTAFERPDQKRAVPGAAALLREIASTGARIHILSGSPRQMKRRIEEKLRIDRVRWDDLTLKPNLENLGRLRFRALRDQLGYKLPVLLEARVRDQAMSGEGQRPVEILVGDDAEADAFVYSLYADICEGLIDADALKKILRAGRVYSDQRSRCLRALQDIRQGPTIKRLLIHLDKQSPPSRFDAYTPRLVPFYNYLQAAFILAEDGVLSGAAVLRVAAIFVLRHRFDSDALARSYLDLMRRGHASGALLPQLTRELQVLGPSEAPGGRQELEKMCELIGGYATRPPEVRPRDHIALDYVALAAKHRSGRNRRVISRI